MYKIKLLVLSLIINLFFINAGKSQCTGWAHTGEPNNDNAWGITLDDDANSYSAGYYHGPSNFGNYTANDTGLFLIKYDSLGNFIWVKTFKGSFPGVFSFLNYSHGAIYLNITFSDTVSFGNYTLGGYGFGSIGVIKFDTDGNVQWARTFPCTSISSGYGIWNTDSGDPLITGRYRGTLTMDGTTLNSSATGFSIYLAKLDEENGNVVWAKSSAIQNTAGGRGYAIRTDGNGNILLSGYYAHILSFGNQILDNSTNSSAFAPYVAKFDSNGTSLWVKGGTGPFIFANVYGLETDSLNNIYFSSPLDTTGTFSGTTLNPLNGSMVIGKYDPSGNLLWLSQMGTHNADSISFASSLHINNNYTLTAYGYGFDQMFFGTDTLISAGGLDIFSVDLDEDGNYLSSFITGGIYNESSYNIAYDQEDHAYIAGQFSGDTTTLGVFGLHGDTLPFTLYTNYFVWKNCTGIGTYVPIGKGNDVSIFPNPGDGLFFVKGISDPRTIMEVYNLEGRIVWRRAVNGENFIDLRKASKGMYVVKIFSGNSLQIMKIVNE